MEVVGKIDSYKNPINLLIDSMNQFKKKMMTVFKNLTTRLFWKTEGKHNVANNMKKNGFSNHVFVILILIFEYFKYWKHDPSR